MDIVLLHGYGASAKDLAPLQYEIAVSASWHFPQAPLKIPYGWAWFPIDIEKLPYEDLSHTTPAGLNEAKAYMEAYLQKIPLSQTILGGFSQGAMVALEVALSMKERPLALALFSTTLLNEERWKKLAKEKAGLPFFQSHGIEDPLLSYSHAKRLEKLLQEAGWKGNCCSFHGGHTISDEVLVKFEEFLETII